MKRFINNIKNNSMAVPFVEILAKGISFINVLLLIRIVSIDEYADYSYVLAIVLWASVLMDGGISNLIYNKSLTNNLKSINILFTGRLILSFLVIFLLITFFILRKQELVIITVIITFVVFFSSFSSLIKMFSRGKGYTNVDVVSIISEPIIRLVFLFFVYITLNNFNWQFWQILVLYLLAGIIAFFISFKSITNFFKFEINIKNFKSSLYQVKESLNESKFYLLYYLMIVGLGRLDIIFIEKYGLKSDLAIFSSALSLYQVVQLFFFSIITSQFLRIIKNKNYIFKYLIPALLFVIIATQFLSKYIYNYLFPMEYLNGFEILNYIILALFPSVLIYYFIIKNNYLNKVKTNFIILSFFFVSKIFIYQYFKSPNLKLYYIVYPMIEIALLIGFLLYSKFYESTSNK